MNKLLLVLLFFITVICLNAQTVVEWKTNMGDFKAELREDLVPVTSYNFRDLTNAGFYDGCIFHRVIADFMIQDGDPTGTGSGGPGYTIPDEFHPELTHLRGVVSMANTGQPNSGGSQYFITVIPTHHLDSLHAVYGHIIEGMDVVDSISVVETNDYNRPIEPVVIDSIRVLTPPVDEFIPAVIRDTVTCGFIELFMIDCDDPSVQYEWYVSDELQSETTSVYLHTFSEADTVEVKCVVSGDYEHDYVLRWRYLVINTSEDEILIKPAGHLCSYPNPFNPQTTITYNVFSDGDVDISIYNLKGQLVKKLISQNREAGVYKVIWDATEEASGIYLLCYRSDTEHEVRKLMLLK